MKEDPSRGSFGASYTLERKAVMETGPVLFVDFYNNTKFAGQWGLSSVSQGSYQFS